jgi:hypothetical protein
MNVEQVGQFMNQNRFQIVFATTIAKHHGHGIIRNKSTNFGLLSRPGTGTTDQGDADVGSTAAAASRPVDVVRVIGIVKQNNDRSSLVRRLPFSAQRPHQYANARMWIILGVGEQSLEQLPALRPAHGGKQEINASTDVVVAKAVPLFEIRS